MDTHHIQQTYELITNPVLRLLIYFMAAAVLACVSGIVYLYRDRQAAYRELLDLNKEATKALTITSEALDALKERLNDLKRSTP